MFTTIYELVSSTTMMALRERAYGSKVARTKQRLAPGRVRVTPGTPETVCTVAVPGAARALSLGFRASEGRPLTGVPALSLESEPGTAPPAGIPGS
eukprot:756083-Hanusia_phi.AAC.1